MYSEKEVTTIVGTVILLLLLIACSVFLGAWIGCWLWSIIAVKIFGFPALTYWQFFGLMILIRVIFIPTDIRMKKKD